jgi:EpsI family protein
MLAGLLTGLALVAVWPAWASLVEGERSAQPPAELMALAEGAGWRRAPAFTDWRPRFMRPEAELEEAYARGSSEVGVHLAYYGRESQGAELISSQNVMVIQKHPVWRHPLERKAQVRLGGRDATVVESHLKSKQQELLAWHWYWVAGTHTSSPYEGKVREALRRVLGAPAQGAGIVVYTPTGEELQVAREALQSFLDEMLPAIEAELDRVAGRGT